MNTTRSKRRSYDEQFKRDAVALLEGGRKAAQIIPNRFQFFCKAFSTGRKPVISRRNERFRARADGFSGFSWVRVGFDG